MVNSTHRTKHRDTDIVNKINITNPINPYLLPFFLIFNRHVFKLIIVMVHNSRYIKNYYIVHVKWTNCIAGELYPNKTVNFKTYEKVQVRQRENRPQGGEREECL